MERFLNKLRLQDLSTTVVLIILMNAIVEFMNVAKREMLLPYLRTLVVCDGDVIIGNAFSGSPKCSDIRIVIEESQAVCGDMDSMNSIVNGIFTPFFGLVCDQKGRKVGLYLGLFGLFLYFSILSYEAYMLHEEWDINTVLQNGRTSKHHPVDPYLEQSRRPYHLRHESTMSNYMWESGRSLISWLPQNPFATPKLPISGLIPIAMMVEGLFNCFEIVFTTMLVDVTLPGPQRALVFAIFSSIGIVLEMSADLLTSSLLLTDFRNYKLLFLCAAIFTLFTMWLSKVFLEETLGHDVFVATTNSALITCEKFQLEDKSDVSSLENYSSSNGNSRIPSKTTTRGIFGGFFTSDGYANEKGDGKSADTDAIEMRDFTGTSNTLQFSKRKAFNTTKDPESPYGSMKRTGEASSSRSGSPTVGLSENHPVGLQQADLCSNGPCPNGIRKTHLPESIRVKKVTEERLRNPILLYSGFDLSSSELNSNLTVGNSSTDQPQLIGKPRNGTTGDGTPNKSGFLSTCEASLPSNPVRRTSEGFVKALELNPQVLYSMNCGAIDNTVTEFEHQAAIEDEIIPYFEFREFHYLAVCKHHLDSTYATKNPVVESILGSSVSPRPHGRAGMTPQSRSDPRVVKDRYLTARLPEFYPGDRDGNPVTPPPRSLRLKKYFNLTFTDVYILFDYTWRFLKHYIVDEIPRFGSYTCLLYAKIFRANPFLQWWCLLQFFLQFAKGLVEVQGSYSILIWGWHAGDLERITVWLTAMYLVGLSCTPYVLSNSAKAHKIIVDLKIDRCLLAVSGTRMSQESDIESGSSKAIGGMIPMKTLEASNNSTSGRAYNDGHPTYGQGGHPVHAQNGHPIATSYAQPGHPPHAQGGHPPHAQITKKVAPIDGSSSHGMEKPVQTKGQIASGNAQQYIQTGESMHIINGQNLLQTTNGLSINGSIHEAVSGISSHGPTGTSADLPMVNIVGPAGNGIPRGEYDGSLAGSLAHKDVLMNRHASGDMANVVETSATSFSPASQILDRSISDVSALSNKRATMDEDEVAMYLNTQEQGVIVSNGTLTNGTVTNGTLSAVDTLKAEDTPSSLTDYTSTTAAETPTADTTSPTAHCQEQMLQKTPLMPDPARSAVTPEDPTSSSEPKMSGLLRKRQRSQVTSTTEGDINNVNTPVLEESRASKMTPTPGKPSGNSQRGTVVNSSARPSRSKMASNERTEQERRGVSSDQSASNNTYTNSHGISDNPTVHSNAQGGNPMGSNSIEGTKKQSPGIIPKPLPVGQLRMVEQAQRLSELSASSNGAPVNFRSILILGAFLNVALEGVLALSAPFNWRVTLTAQGGRSMLAWYHSLKTSYVTTKIPEEQRATSLAIITVIHSFAEASADFLFSHYFFISTASMRWMLGLPYYVAFCCILCSEVILVFVVEKYKDVHYGSEELD